MREVLVQQNENLLQKVEDLTEERRTADHDRKQLLSRTADLLAEVDKAEARIKAKPAVESDIKSMEASRQTLVVEVERLRRTNDALCHQVLGEDAEGVFAGCLEPNSAMSSLAPASADSQELYAEVGRLVHGQLLRGSSGDSVQADASALALRLQQTLAEREEAFWVERQRLSDRVTALERTRGGRTSAMLKEYGKTVQGTKGGDSGASGAGGAPGGAGGLATAKEGAAAAAKSVKGSFKTLKGMLA